MKRDYLPHELGETTVDAMRKVRQSCTRKQADTDAQQIKLAFDPLCILNPDKVVRIQKPVKGEVAEW